MIFAFIAVNSSGVRRPCACMSASFCSQFDGAAERHFL
jgi:hypothetical protein